MDSRRDVIAEPDPREAAQELWLRLRAMPVPQASERNSTPGTRRKRRRSVALSGEPGAR